jgi:Holliday junction resolvase
MARVGQTRKRDKAEGPIVDALRACGAFVVRVSAPGAPDLFVLHRGRWTALEVKTGKGKTTPAQDKAGAGRLWHVARSVDEALALVGVRC